MSSGSQIATAAKISLLRQALAKRPDSPALLFELSEALADNPADTESIELFRRAFELKSSASGGVADPGPNPNPETGRKMRARANALIQTGLTGSAVIAALAIGEALCGNESAVRSLVDYDRLFRAYSMEPPDGFDDFYSTLSAEIRANMKFYDSPRDRSIRKGWRNDETTRSPLPASAALTAAFRREVESYIDNLPRDAAHPYLSSRPKEFRIAGWAVISDGSSYHEPHIHPAAWMGGVYYVVRPPASRERGSRRGWLTVGPPELGQNRPVSVPGWETRMVEPEPGNLVLMPSYFFHRTYPIGLDQERICVAFDVIPID